MVPPFVEPPVPCSKMLRRMPQAVTLDVPAELIKAEKLSWVELKCD